jgi:5'-nucleotidase
LVTARNAPAHERAIRTLRAWNVRIDEAFFLGGMNKSDILKAFGAHIFFDDQAIHTEPASEVVPSARVPYKSLK